MSKQAAVSKQQKQSKRKLSKQTEQSYEQKSKQTILDARLQLDEMINHIDDKIRNRLQLNESRFLYAYRNHLERITKEMKLLKEHYDAQESKFSTDKVINQLGKQCALFRQQAIRLSNQLEDALVEIDVYRRKSELLEKENKRSDETIKNLMKMNKRNEVQKSKLIVQTTQKQRTISILNNNLNESRKFEAIVKLRTEQSQSSSQKIQHKDKQNKSFQKPMHNIDISELFVGEQQDMLHQIQNLSGSNRQETNYPVFELDRPKQFLHTSRGKSFKSSSRQHNRTQSTNDYYNRSLKQVNMCEQLGNKKESDQHKMFNDFIQNLRKARQNCQTHDLKEQMQAKYIDQFIRNDYDIRHLCLRLFPTLQINEKLQVISQDTESRIKKDTNQRKTNNEGTVSHKFLRKFNFSNLTQRVATREKNVKKSFDLQVDNFNMNIIHKKSNMKTEEPAPQLNDLGLVRLHSMQKMKDSFKRKNLNKKSFVNKAHMSARRHTNLQFTN